MFENKTFESILEQMLSEVDTEIDKREGSMIYDALAPCAMRLAEAYRALSDLEQQLNPETASGKFLLALGEKYGVQRKGATPAILLMQAEPQTLDIPIGTRFFAGECTYTVSGKNDDGNWLLTAEQDGTVGDVLSGSAIPAEYLQGLLSAQIVGIYRHGVEQENDAHYRARVIKAMRRISFGGNRADYETWIKQDERVVYARVSPAWVTGSDIVIEVLGQGYDFLENDVIAALQERICPTSGGNSGTGIAPIGHSVKIKRPTVQEISIDLTMDLQEDAIVSEVRQQVTDALTAYLEQLREKWERSETITLYREDMIRIVKSIGGVISVSRFLINGLALDLSTDDLPILLGVHYGTSADV